MNEQKMKNKQKTPWQVEKETHGKKHLKDVSSAYNSTSPHLPFYNLVVIPIYSSCFGLDVTSSENLSLQFGFSIATCFDIVSPFLI